MKNNKYNFNMIHQFTLKAEKQILIVEDVIPWTDS